MTTAQHRHCLPRRVSAMLNAVSSGKDLFLQSLIGAGCRCADHCGCDLKDACNRIHQSFKPERTN